MAVQALAIVVGLVEFDVFGRGSYLNPLRHVILILRGIYLKGVGLEVFWPEVAMLAVFAVVMASVSILRFRKSLELGSGLRRQSNKKR